MITCVATTTPSSWTSRTSKPTEGSVLVGAKPHAFSAKNRGRRLHGANCEMFHVGPIRTVLNGLQHSHSATSLSPASRTWTLDLQSAGSQGHKGARSPAK